jgi:hypothetical protein
VNGLNGNKEVGEVWEGRALQGFTKGSWSCQLSLTPA